MTSMNRSTMAVACTLFVALVLCVGSALGHGQDHRSPVHFINVEATTLGFEPAIQMQVSAKTVTNGEFVTVSWSGVSAPSDGDWVGVYSPSTTDMLTHVPIKFQFANKSSTHATSGSGSLRFQLLNLRADYIFSFMRGGIVKPVVAATSSIVTFANYNEPFETHLALGMDDAHMRVMWVTRNSSVPVVTWGPSSTIGLVQPSVTKATTATYTADDLCGSPANSTGWRDPGMIHSATLGPLTPGEEYSYTVGDVFGHSKMYTFVAPPLTAPETSARFVAFGDLGRGEIDDSIDGKYWKWGNYSPSIWTTNALIKGLDTFDVVLNIGDTSYADGVASEWDEFFHQIAPVAQHKPWMTCIGNHELDWPVAFSFFKSYDSQGECGVPQEMRFGMPRPDGTKQPWYSFNYGNVHVTLMSTEHDFTAGSVQHAWILADLAAIDSSKTPWVIFTGHRPFYVDSTWNTGPDGDGFVASMLRGIYEEHLVKSGVDLAIFGHHHTYQRTCAVYNKTCVQKSVNGRYTAPGAPVYNVIGMAGAPLTTNFKPQRPDYFEFVDEQNHGFFRIDTTATEMHAQFVSLQANGDEAVLDEFWITK